MDDSRTRQIIIAVIGASNIDSKLAAVAEEVGREIAACGCILICGGLGGVMEHAAKGAKSAGGLTIGILPTDTSSYANNYIDIPINTGMGEARNIILVKSADALVAIGKGLGTLSEISFALKLEKPIIGINTWNISDQILSIENPKQAVACAIKTAGEMRN